jgi:hypothetical protein
LKFYSYPLDEGIPPDFEVEKCTAPIFSRPAVKVMKMLPAASRNRPVGLVFSGPFFEDTASFSNYFVSL